MADLETSDTRPSFRMKAPSAAQIRLVSGLILFLFATTHFINHAFGLVSIDAMNEGQAIRTAFTRSLPGSIVLLAAAVLHFVFGLQKFFQVDTWRIGWRNLVQLVFGLAIPLLLVRHVAGTRGMTMITGIKDSYTHELWALWPYEALNQGMLMLLVWVHGCIGIQNWIGRRPWYQRTRWLWYGLALLIPSLGYAGFVTAGRIEAIEGSYSFPYTQEQFDRVVRFMSDSTETYYVILGAAVLIWAITMILNRLGSRVTVSYVNGPTVHAPGGLTLLAISRINRIPHASVCGGRARCSTCRVRVVSGGDALAPPSEQEAQVLRRVGAPANVRLACQLRPVGHITVSTLLPARIDPNRDQPADRYLWGVEHAVTIMFCDLRGFTRMAEGRLSYDVVFLLNQFLGRMAEAISDTGGFVDKFMGDGIMAIFGMDDTPERGARQAIAAARAMGGVLDSLNQSLKEALPAPLSMGIGLHSGHAILGRIGAVQDGDGRAGGLTALGETVNLASRLETKTKELGVQVILSARCAELGGLDLAAVEMQSVEIRGLSQSIEIVAMKRAMDLPAVSTA